MWRLSVPQLDFQQGKEAGEQGQAGKAEMEEGKEDEEEEDQLETLERNSTKTPSQQDGRGLNGGSFLDGSSFHIVKIFLSSFFLRENQDMAWFSFLSCDII